MDATPHTLYAPPAAVGQPIKADAATRSAPFYVVSPGKFHLLFFATFGLYGVFGFYTHWQRDRQGRAETIWPVPRAIVSICFVHALVRHIDASLTAQRQRHAWSPAALATGYIVLEIVSNGLSRLDGRGIGSPATGLLALASRVPAAWVLMRIQTAANLACGDPAGAGNRRLGWANGIWLAIGVVGWSLVVAGLLLPA